MAGVNHYQAYLERLKWQYRGKRIHEADDEESDTDNSMHGIRYTGAKPRTASQRASAIAGVTKDKINDGGEYITVHTRSGKEIDFTNWDEVEDFEHQQLKRKKGTMSVDISANVPNENLVDERKGPGSRRRIQPMQKGLAEEEQAEKQFDILPQLPPVARISVREAYVPSDEEQQQEYEEQDKYEDEQYEEEKEQDEKNDEQDEINQQEQAEEETYEDLMEQQQKEQYEEEQKENEEEEALEDYMEELQKEEMAEQEEYEDWEQGFNQEMAEADAEYKKWQQEQEMGEEAAAERMEEEEYEDWSQNHQKKMAESQFAYSQWKQQQEKDHETERLMRQAKMDKLDEERRAQEKMLLERKMKFENEDRKIAADNRKKAEEEWLRERGGWAPPEYNVNGQRRTMADLRAQSERNRVEYERTNAGNLQRKEDREAKHRQNIEDQRAFQAEQAASQGQASLASNLAADLGYTVQMSPGPGGYFDVMTPKGKRSFSTPEAATQWLQSQPKPVEKSAQEIPVRKDANTEQYHPELLPNGEAIVNTSDGNILIFDSKDQAMKYLALMPTDGSSIEPLQKAPGDPVPDPMEMQADIAPEMQAPPVDAEPTVEPTEEELAAQPKLWYPNPIQPPMIPPNDPEYKVAEAEAKASIEAKLQELGGTLSGAVPGFAIELPENYTPNKSPSFTSWQQARDWMGTEEQVKQEIVMRESRRKVSYHEWRKSRRLTEGGEGSGNFDHAGRPGEVGGSSPQSGGTVSRKTSRSGETRDPSDTAGKHSRPKKYEAESNWAKHLPNWYGGIYGGLMRQYILGRPKKPAEYPKYTDLTEEQQGQLEKMIENHDTLIYAGGEATKVLPDVVVDDVLRPAAKKVADAIDFMTYDPNGRKIQDYVNFTTYVLGISARGKFKDKFLDSDFIARQSAKNLKFDEITQTYTNTKTGEIINNPAVMGKKYPRWLFPKTETGRFMHYVANPFGIAANVVGSLFMAYGLPRFSKELKKYAQGDPRAFNLFLDRYLKYKPQEDSDEYNSLQESFWTPRFAEADKPKVALNAIGETLQDEHGPIPQVIGPMLTDAIFDAMEDLDEDEIELVIPLMAYLGEENIKSLSDNGKLLPLDDQGQPIVSLKAQKSLGLSDEQRERLTPIAMLIVTLGGLYTAWSTLGSEIDQDKE